MSKTTGSKPRIGLTITLRRLDFGPKRLYQMVFATYPDAVREAGGIPILIPTYEFSDEELKEYLNTVDGMLFIGGFDYPPSFYGEAPDPHTEDDKRLCPKSDLLLMQAALNRGLPVLGICGGCQLLNIALGGKLIQHMPEAEQHIEGKFHSMQIIKDGIFAHALDKNIGGKLEVNSFHHQALNPKALGKGLSVMAKAPDGTIEVVEKHDSDWVVGVQFHPERMMDSYLPLFRSFIDAAKQLRK